MTKEEANRKARNLAKETGRVYAVRNDYGRYFVCPMYIDGRHFPEVDVGYEALGSLVQVWAPES